MQYVVKSKLLGKMYEGVRVGRVRGAYGGVRGNEELGDTTNTVFNGKSPSNRDLMAIKVAERMRTS